MNLQDFKKEFKLVNSGDAWGEATGILFEVCGHLGIRGVDIPAEYEYRPGMGGYYVEEDSYWYELFILATDEELIAIGNLCDRLRTILELKGMSY